MSALRCQINSAPLLSHRSQSVEDLWQELAHHIESQLLRPQQFPCCSRRQRDPAFWAVATRGKWWKWPSEPGETAGFHFRPPAGRQRRGPWAHTWQPIATGLVGLLGRVAARLSDASREPRLPNSSLITYSSVPKERAIHAGREFVARCRPRCCLPSCRWAATSMQ
jgi:hypothetical protein